MTHDNTIYRFHLAADPFPLGLGAMIELGGATSVALNGDGTSRQPIAWPTHEEDVAELSRQYPLVRFTLRAETLDGTAGWAKAFLNGERADQGDPNG